MNKADCVSEKISSKTIGLLVLPVALFMVVVVNILLPVIGTVLAFPLLLLSGGLLAAPQSEECRLINGQQ